MHESLPGIIHEAARRFGDRPAIRTGPDVLTYAELDAGIGAFAARVAEISPRGSRIGILLPNLSAFPILLHGVLAAEMTAVMLNPLDSPRGIAEYITASAARVVITTRRLAGALPPSVGRIYVDELPAALWIEGPEGERGPVPLGGADAALPVGPRGNDAAVIVFTAATEGRSRGARLSDRNLIANLRSTIEAMQIGPDDWVVAALPLIHLFGLTVTLNAPLAAGACVLPVERFHPVRLLELFEEERATVFAGVPAMFMALISAAERRGTPEHQLRVAICGGAPLPLETALRWEEVFGIPLREGYGLTEAGPVCLFNRVDRPSRPGTLGFPFPGVEVTIRAESGEILPPGEVGEICIQGENVFGGYLGEDGRSARDFHGEALRTGDLGNVEPDGRIRFRGFLKPMFTRNGFNVYPRELERVLMEDARIAGAQVCAQPDFARENEIVLFVRPAAGASLTEEDVRNLCSKRLASYKQPGRIHISDVTDAG